MMGGPVALVMLALVVVPCMAILLQSLVPGSTAPEGSSFPSLTNYLTVLEGRATRQALVRTLEVSVWVTLLSVCAGYPLAFHIARQGRPWAGIFLAVVIFPFLVSAVVRAYGWGVVLGEKGVINEGLLAFGLISEPIRLMHTEIAIIIGETHLLLPYMVLALLSTLRSIDPNIELAALSLGASPPSVFLRVLLPATFPALTSGTLLVFTLAMTAFATPFLLGGTRAPLLTTVLYRYAFVTLDWNRAAAIGGILFAMGALFFLLHRWAGRGGLDRMGADS